MLLYSLLKKPFFGRFQKPWRWPDDVGGAERWERVRFPSASGAELAGLYAAPAAGPARGAVVLAHPMGTAAKGFFLKRGHAELLLARGYAVLAFDFNGFGESANGSFDYPADVAAAGRWMKARRPELKVGVLGVSFGAAWAVAALAEPGHDFDAAVLECPFTTLEEYWYRYKTAYAMLKLISALRPGLVAKLRPIERVRDVRRATSLLFIYGGEDDITPVEMGKRFLKNMPTGPSAPRARLWVADGAKHTEAIADRAGAYADKVAAAFDAALTLRS
jgi:alpha-beta hydrolase superfamily lysophospholipase